MRLRPEAFIYWRAYKAMRDKQLKRHARLTTLEDTLFILSPEFCRLVPVVLNKGPRHSSHQQVALLILPYLCFLCFHGQESFFDHHHVVSLSGSHRFQ